ncbi:MAG: DUF4342 domain-containing protein [Sphingobacterium sp.]|uniref:DUF4342 domain-containing protein n=1 Tax=Sphingobacterium sp. JB170 TaxID=1434842 RepID=UPI00097F2978|nr:DUF4342 domain-containing protein [Sphingobacterium sp. JB170]SJN40101.1 hypothetical protein FM107_10440 [Sphingobacterium sp. JB170]
MKNSSTFNFSFESITQLINSTFTKIKKTNVKIAKKSGEQYMSLPLIVALIITCILPFIVIAGVIIILIFDIDIIFERQIDKLDRIEE